MDDLVKRIEASYTQNQYVLLKHVFELHFSDSPDWFKENFFLLLEAQAFESAMFYLYRKKQLRLLSLTDLNDGVWVAKLWKQPARLGNTPALALLNAFVQSSLVEVDTPDIHEFASQNIKNALGNWLENRALDTLAFMDGWPALKVFVYVIFHPHKTGISLGRWRALVEAARDIRTL